MVTRLRRGQQVWRHFGTRWMFYRGQYAAQQKTGWLERRLPAASWDSQPLAALLADAPLADPDVYLDYRRRQAPRFFFSTDHRLHYQALLHRWDEGQETPLRLIERLAAGQWRFFEHTWLPVGFPPDWLRNAVTEETITAQRHWSRIPDFGHGDIKVVWEPSRFGFVYALVRAYWRTGDEQYAEIFWQLVESWRTVNPPQQGPNWKCGQETSLRVMAWCFGLYGFLAAAATTPQRVGWLAQMIALSGQRIEANLGYALSQRNNHGISEGMGLWTIGLLFPEFRSASAWQELGQRALETQGRELIYDDGAFVQHSVNYHRLMLHDYLWSFRLGDLAGQPLSADLRQRVGEAGQFLFQIQDQSSGRVPYYGQNDGALILPLSNCDYQDFRPVVQATHFLSSGQRRYGDGPWDEDLLWLFGPEALQAPLAKAEPTDLAAKTGGYYTLRSPQSFVFTRCATYHHRPGQADMLHVDLWWRGQNIALDAGTYSYNAPAPWDNPLAHTAYHNTVTVDEQDQMERAGKFLWLPWLSGQVHAIKRSQGGQIAYWEGSHNGYQRLAPPVSHRRAIIRLGEETWLIVDQLRSTTAHRYRLHWLLADWPHKWQPALGRLVMQTAQGDYAIRMSTEASSPSYSLVRADADSPRGWQAHYYTAKQPAVSLALGCIEKNVRFYTLFGPATADMSLQQDAVQMTGAAWEANVTMAEAEAPLLISQVLLAGDLHDRLVLQA